MSPLMSLRHNILDKCRHDLSHVSHFTCVYPNSGFPHRRKPSNSLTMRSGNPLSDMLRRLAVSPFRIALK